MSRPRPRPPRPSLRRSPAEPFGWLEARLLHEGWLARLGPDATSVLLLLALAADGQGASFYSRTRMGERLALASARLDRALAQLLSLGLVAHRPWRPGQREGVWQLLPLPPPLTARRGGGPLSAAALLARLGLAPGGADPRKPPESRGS